VRVCVAPNTPTVAAPPAAYLGATRAILEKYPQIVNEAPALVDLRYEPPYAVESRTRRHPLECEIDVAYAAELSESSATTAIKPLPYIVGPGRPPAGRVRLPL
jgi:hypothetical protein